MLPFVKLGRTNLRARLSTIVKTVKNGGRRRARDLGLPFTTLLVYAVSGPAVRFLHRPVQNERLARLEERLFGRVPTVALQRYLDRPEGLSAWTEPLAIVYVSHFVVPSFSWVWLWSRDRERWTRCNREFLLLAAASLLTYVVVPAAPPWLASRDGYIGPVRRLSSPGLAKLGWTTGARWLARGQAQVNEVAALPSMHAAYALLVAWNLSSKDTSALGRLLLGVYPAAMAIALVALGEHYVTDVVLGGVYVVAVKLIL